MSDYKTCPHDSETFIKEPGVASYRCPECKNRICLDCRRYGEQHSMIPLVSWMTGFCGTCGQERRRRADIRKDFYDSQSRRARLAESWDEGFQAGATWPSAPDGTPSDPPLNPHHKPTSAEEWLLEQNDWLRAEVASEVPS